MNERPRAKIKVVPEDFVVEEIPAYEPSGDGEHVYVRFTKRELTSDAAARAIASALGANPRDVGIAGMKDKRAVTTQSISLLTPRGTSPADLEARARALVVPGIAIHDARRHGNKLKPGHLVGNRFTIRARDVPTERVAEVVATFHRVASEGLPNAFGSQRFGMRGDNAERAREWIAGRTPAPRDPRIRRLHWSALQSAIFNAVLDARVAEDTWATPLEGDLLKRRTSGGLFICADVQADRARGLEGEVSPTGPILGVKMRAPEGRPAELERSIAARILGKDFDLSRTKALGEGSRRVLRLWIEDLRVDVDSGAENGEQVAGLRVYFVLPKGAYATTVLSAALALHEDESNTDAPAVPETDGEQTDP